MRYPVEAPLTVDHPWLLDRMVCKGSQCCAVESCNDHKPPLVLALRPLCCRGIGSLTPRSRSWAHTRVPCVCIRAKACKRRLSCRATSTKCACRGLCTSLHVPCAAPAAIWMLESIFDVFGLQAAYLDSEQTVRISQVTFRMHPLTSHRSITGGGA